MTHKNIIDLKQVCFAYHVPAQADVLAVQNTSITVHPGQHVVILGRNGSGKSTVAKLINALLLPSSGSVVVAGFCSDDPEQVIDIRRRCGMVFQNPDNQIVGTTVEEDVAFGPENLGVPSSELPDLIDSSLIAVGLEDYREQAPTQLSGGQKQKLAIAGILAMKPQCMILDESTSMLDPASAREFMDLVTKLREEQGITVVEITHDMQAAMQADYVYVMSEGEIVNSGTPREIFTQPEQLLAAGLEIPAHLAVLHDLAPQFFTGTGSRPFTYDEVTDALQSLQVKNSDYKLDEASVQPNSQAPIIMEISGLSHTYGQGSPNAFQALTDIDLTIRRGEFVALVGHSGSGKSTLITHFNGLMIPQTGSVKVCDLFVKEKKDIKQIRKHVGLLFQYPEYQLFEESVYLDIAYGPKQLGMTEDEIKQAVLSAAADTGIDENLLDRSPFDLSGGQKRRVAIAGVLSMNPDVLVLDEPAAGLDPVGRREILGYLKTLKNRGKTIVLVTHNMEDAAELADRIVVLNRGKIVADGTPEQIFSDQDLLKKAKLTVPAITAYANYLVQRQMIPYTVFRQADLVNLLRGNLTACFQTGSEDKPSDVRRITSTEE